MIKVKRIAAWIGVTLIASMYIISLISAFLATEYTNGLFLASIFTTFVVPVFIWFFLLFYKLAHKNASETSTEDSNLDSVTNQDNDILS
jgi:amino acid permease